MVIGFFFLNNRPKGPKNYLYKIECMCLLNRPRELNEIGHGASPRGDGLNWIV